MTAGIIIVMKFLHLTKVLIMLAETEEPQEQKYKDGPFPLRNYSLRAS